MNKLFLAKLNKEGADFIGAQEGEVLSQVIPELCMEVNPQLLREIDIITNTHGETAFWHEQGEPKGSAGLTMQDVVFLGPKHYTPWIQSPLALNVTVKAPFSWFSNGVGWKTEINETIELPYDVPASNASDLAKETVLSVGTVPVENITSYEAAAEATAKSLKWINATLCADEVNFPFIATCSDTDLVVSVDIQPRTPIDYL